jgi:hypothetical protein
MNLNLRLEKVMPKVKLNKVAAKKEVEEDLEIAEQPVERPQPRVRIDELEQELADIEKRMSGLR